MVGDGGTINWVVICVRRRKQRNGGFKRGDAFFDALELGGRQGGRVDQGVDESVDGFEEREFCDWKGGEDALFRGRSLPSMRLMSFRVSLLESSNRTPRDLPLRSWETPEMICI